MTVSEVTQRDLLDYLRIDDSNPIEENEVSSMYKSAIAYITAYTGLTESELDEHEDITQALFLLVADMFDNRNLYVDNKTSTRNRAVESILNLHSVNII